MWQKIKHYWKRILVTLGIVGVAFAANVGGEIEAPTHVNINGERISLSYTDDNEGETYIIKGESDHVTGKDVIPYYFSITNTGGAESAYIRLLHDTSATHRIEEVKLDVDRSYDKAVYGERYETGKMVEDEGGNSVPETKRDQIGMTTIERYVDEFQTKVLTRAQSRTALKSTGRSADKEFTTSFGKGETKYFKAYIKVPKADNALRGVSGGFSIEVIGENGYGLLR